MQGKAMLDGGATKTLASVTAMEAIMNLNAQKKGSHGVNSLDLQDRPVFGFGNSSSDRCLSAAQLQVCAGGKPGSLKIHTLDKGDGPVLFSVDALRSLGAVIDFEADLICFRHLSDKHIVKLEQSNTGHQLLPLTEDWFSQSQEVAHPVPSLKAFL